MIKSIVEIENLSFSYPDGTPALKNISLKIAQGEKVGIVGPNGAGKSTFLLHLNGIYRGTGFVRIDGLDIADKNLSVIRRKVGIIFQDPDNQLFMPTVFDDVAFGPINMQYDRERAVRASEEALQKVEMGYASKRTSHHLSYGEKKRVSIATVLSMSPELIAFDEPTSNLDPKARNHLMDLINKLERTIIIASHDLGMIYEICGRTMVLDRGALVADGATAQILADKAFLKKHNLL
ncbi:MAG: cobalt ABC transporter ATP-binding protein [Omnitrophica bacterium RBG_13_46_9]|nr:MAG: cobalt ABC transporter ATP-binding protein [Omnitrophica bacterium RBG_13_46_9]